MPASRSPGARPTALLPFTQLLRISLYWLGLTAIDAAVSQYIATLNWLAMVNARTLVNTGVLVRTGVFGQVVDVDTGFTRYHFIFIYLNDNTAGVDVIDYTTTFSNNGYT